MNLYEVIKARKSVRSFLSTPVEKEKIHNLLEAARLAPSARNSQEWRFVVVEDFETIQNIVKKSVPGQEFIAEAPVLIVCCAVTDKALMRCGHPRYAVDCAVAVDHLMLAAVEEGLGTCWIGGFQQDPIKKILDIPEQVEVFALLPTGYAANPDIAEKSRKSMDEIICYENWDNS